MDSDTGIVHVVAPSPPVTVHSGTRVVNRRSRFTVHLATADRPKHSDKTVCGIVMKGNNILDSTSPRCDTHVLRGSVGRYPYNHGEHLVVAIDLWVYGDSSGSNARPYCTVSAYIGSPRAWDTLRPDWDAILSSKGLAEVHAVDLFTRRLATTESTNPYKEWSWVDVQAFIDQLTTAIRRRRNIRPIEAVVDVDAFKALSLGERRALTSGRFLQIDEARRKWKSSGKPSEPYMLAFQAVVKAALLRCPDDARVHFVFDQDKGVEGLADMLVREIRDLKLWPEYARLGGVAFEDSRDFPGIQLADLRGYLINRYVQFGDGMGPEEGYTYLKLSKDDEFQVFSAESLEKTLAANFSLKQRAWLNSWTETHNL